MASEEEDLVEEEELVKGKMLHTGDTLVAVRAAGVEAVDGLLDAHAVMVEDEAEDLKEGLAAVVEEVGVGSALAAPHAVVVAEEGHISSKEKAERVKQASLHWK